MFSNASQFEILKPKSFNWINFFLKKENDFYNVRIHWLDFRRLATFACLMSLCHENAQ